MGKTAQVLLVVVLCVASGCCSPTTKIDHTHTRVDPETFDAFWLWAGVKRNRPYVQHARTLYVLEGEFGLRRQQLHYTNLSAGIPKHTSANIWLVYRTSTLNWQPSTFTFVIRHAIRLRQQGVQIVGIQIDFDAQTPQLGKYVLFLQQLRQQLPPTYRLSVTGLLDWTNAQNHDTLRQLSQTVDEIVLQTYQYKSTVAHYSLYVQRLMRLNIPFKLGLVEQGEWTPPAGLLQHPYFKGFVIFLL